MAGAKLEETTENERILSVSPAIEVSVHSIKK